MRLQPPVDIYDVLTWLLEMAALTGLAMLLLLAYFAWTVG